MRYNYQYNFNSKKVQLGAKLNRIYRNTDLVEAGGYYDIATGIGTSSFGLGSANINLNNLSVIRQTGKLVKIKYFNSQELPDTIKLQIWRKTNNLWTRVAESADLRSKITINTINDVQLDTALDVQEGDYVGFEGTGYETCFLRAGTYIAKTYCYASLPISYTDYDWLAQSNSTSILPIKSYMQAPLIVLIGSSSMAGRPGHYSGIENSMVNNPANSIGYQLYQLNNKLVCQQMGIGSQTSTNMAARFDNDCIALKPKFALIYAGTNDIAGGVITKATFLANYTSMLDKCAANGIIPIALNIMPWTNGTDEQMIIRDEWNADLKALVESYPKGKSLDASSVVGQYRATGTEGNLWDIKTSLAADGVHLNLAGYTALSAYIKEQIFDKYKLG